MDILTLPVTMRKPSKKDDDIIEFVGSTDRVDRMGDIIEQNWDLKAYRKNPVFLWGHRNSDLPLGKAVRVWNEKIGKAADSAAKRALMFMIKFVPEDLHPFAAKVKGMYDAGFLSATSVGFRPLARKSVTEKEREDLGLGAWGQVFTKSELLELSAVTVPANPDALKKGAIIDAIGERHGGLFFDVLNGVDVPAEELMERYYDGMDAAGVRQYIDAIELAIGSTAPGDDGSLNVTIDDDEIVRELDGMDEAERTQFLTTLFTKDNDTDGTGTDEESDADASATDADATGGGDAETDGEAEADGDGEGTPEPTDATDADDSSPSSDAGDDADADDDDDNEERTARLHPDDIEAIAERVAQIIGKNDNPEGDGEGQTDTDDDSDADPDDGDDEEELTELLSDATALADVVGASD